MNLRNLYFLILLFSLSACGHDEQADATLQQAADIHAEAVKIEQEIKPRLEELIQAKNSINVQGRALTSEEQDFVKAVERIEASYAYWEENHVEVPGHEHDHEHEEGHNHDHDHDHAAELSVTPDDMLLIQQEFRDSILYLQQLISTVQLPAN